MSVPYFPNRKHENRLHDAGMGDVYSYDDVYRLVKVKYNVPDPVNDIGAPSSTADFNYDGLGNRDSVVTNGTPTYYTHNNMNEYDDVGGATQVHDNNGNLIDDGTYLYAWDYENRLTEVRLKADNSLVAYYYYDALSRRIEKQTPTPTTRYYYDGAHVIEERDGTETVLAHYTYGRRIDEILTMKRGGQTYYYHTNALGSVSAVTNSTGAVVERYTYTAYGQMSITDGQGNPLSSTAIGNPYGFTGRRCDEETGLWHYRNRYYNPVTGRFISRDPLGYLDGLNLFEYVKSNPIISRDPFGLEEQKPALPRPIVSIVVDIDKTAIDPLTGFPIDHAPTWFKALRDEVQKWNEDPKRVIDLQIVIVTARHKAITIVLVPIGFVFRAADALGHLIQLDIIAAACQLVRTDPKDQMHHAHDDFPPHGGPKHFALKAIDIHEPAKGKNLFEVIKDKDQADLKFEYMAEENLDPGVIIDDNKAIDKLVGDGTDRPYIKAINPDEVDDIVGETMKALDENEQALYEQYKTIDNQ